MRKRVLSWISKSHNDDLANKFLNWWVGWAIRGKPMETVTFLGEFYAIIPDSDPYFALFTQKVRDWLVRLPPKHQEYLKALSQVAATEKLKPIAQLTQTLIIIKRIIPDGDMKAFAERVRIANQLLDELSSSYHEKDKTPIDFNLLAQELSSLAEAQLDDEARQKLGENASVLADHVYDLGKSFGDLDRGKFRWLTDFGGKINRSLTEGRMNPQSSVGLLKWISGLMQR